jgi:hypothetical protein
MPITKPTGVTSTERMLADLCEKTFLALWSYPSPTKDDGKELCDLLAVFDNHVFIFFDREGKQLASEDASDVDWERWKRKVIEAQIVTAHGAERYIRNGRTVYLDRKMTTEFPIPINRDRIIVHKIIVAHGAKEACERSSPDNLSGSLAVSYGTGPESSGFPFMIHLDKSNPVHVLDTNTLPLILGELDTFFDFSAFLDEKVRAIQQLDFLVYCGEEDLLAHYYANFNENEKRHFIGVTDPTIAGVFIPEGDWVEINRRPEFIAKKRANSVSYAWDSMIQKACASALAGTLISSANILEGRSAIHEMAREPRFMRRFYAERIRAAVLGFPEKCSAGSLVRQVTYFASFYDRKAYVFLQIVIDGVNDYEEYRAARRALLQIACGALRNRIENLHTIIAIAVEPPKLFEVISEDFLLFDCSDWTEDLRLQFEEKNAEMQFFGTSALQEGRANIQAFPSAD